MNTLRNIIFALPILVLAIAGAVAAEKSPLPAIQGEVKGYTVPAKDYLLKGDSAEFQTDGSARLKGVTLETRRGTNQLNFILHTPSGQYRRKKDGDVITSTNTLDVRSLDRRFHLTGSDYEYHAGTKRLEVHSNVVTRFDRRFFERKSPPKTPADEPAKQAPLRVTSTAFEFDGVTGDAAYRRAVHFSDGDSLDVNAGLLALNVAALTNVNRRVSASNDVSLRLKLLDGFAVARSAAAEFSAAPGIDGRVELTGHPVWTNNLLSGSADRVNWQTVSNRYEFVGEGDARARFPLSMFGTNQGPAQRRTTVTNRQWIDLQSDSHRFVPGRLTFNGNVVARQDTNWMMSTRRFLVDLDATNNPTRMEAEGDFVFEVETGPHAGRGSADHALVENQNDRRPKVTLTGKPRWVSSEFDKSADRIEVVDPLGDPVYSGDGHVRLTLKGLRAGDLDWFGARTNSSGGDAAVDSTNTEPVLITADHSRYQAGLAEFTGNVAVVSGTNFLTAPKLSLWFTLERRLTNLLASGGVKVRQEKIVLTAQQLAARFDGTRRNVPAVDASGDVRLCGGLGNGLGRGTGRSLHYDGKTGEAVLDGDPELLSFKIVQGKLAKNEPPVRYKSPQVQWNLRDETLRLIAPYSVESLSPDEGAPFVCE